MAAWTPWLCYITKGIEAKSARSWSRQVTQMRLSGTKFHESWMHVVSSQAWLCVHRLWCASLCCRNAEHSLSKLRLWKNNSCRHANKLQRLRNKQFGHKVLLLNYIANCKKAKGIHAVSFNWFLSGLEWIFCAKSFHSDQTYLNRGLKIKMWKS